MNRFQENSFEGKRHETHMKKLLQEMEQQAK